MTFPITNDVVMATRLFHSADISALLEEAEFEAEEKRCKSRKQQPAPRREIAQLGMAG